MCDFAFYNLINLISFPFLTHKINVSINVNDNVYTCLLAIPPVIKAERRWLL